MARYTFRSSLRLWSLLSLLALGLAGGALAGPQDARVGETRVLYKAAGAQVRGEPKDTAAPIGSLPARTQVVVQEVQLPWIKVQGAAPGQPPLSGWIKSYLAIEPAALSGNPRPASVGAGASAGLSHAEASAAGRRFSAETERGFRAQRRDLEGAYGHVDQMLANTAALDPAESIEFILEGYLSRPGADLGLPGRLPPSPPRQGSGRKGGGNSRGGGPLGFLPGAAKDLLKRAGADARLVDVLGTVANVMVQGFLEDMNKAFTPDQEFYVGRAVAAEAIAQFGVEPNPALRAYVRRVGDALVRSSPRVPPNFGGYHFEVLASDEVNGISGPGGFILVTRGAVLQCATEDELAGILAHELSHVVQKHGEQVLRQGQQFQNNLKSLVTIGASAAGMDDSRLAQGLVNFMGQVVGEMGRVSREHAYGSGLEYASDADGTRYLHDVNYDWGALRNLLARMGATGHAHGGASHASPQQRAHSLGGTVGSLGAYVPKPGAAEYRKARHDASLGRGPAPQ